jgi:glycerophosphoryl diester phosphodiesterase
MKISKSLFLIVMGAIHFRPMHRLQNFLISVPKHTVRTRLMPENTIIAMQNAMSIEGITTLEMDTHITKDEKLSLLMMII